MQIPLLVNSQPSISSFPTIHIKRGKWKVLFFNFVDSDAVVSLTEYKTVTGTKIPPNDRTIREYKKDSIIHVENPHTVVTVKMNKAGAEKDLSIFLEEQ